MAERLNALVLKTSVPKGSGGSNPSFSAKGNPQLFSCGFFIGFNYSSPSGLKELNPIKNTASSFSDDAWVSMLALDSLLGSMKLIPFSGLKELNPIKNTASSFSDDAWVSMLALDSLLGSMKLIPFLA